MRKIRDGIRNPLLQQQKRRLEERVRSESSLHRTIEQQMTQREHGHALVVGHERADHRARLPARQPRRRVVDRLEQAKFPGQSLRGESLQVDAGSVRRDRQRQRRRIRRDDDVFGEPPFEPKARDTERAILVVEVRVDGVVARLRHAPRHAELPAICDLSLHRGETGLVEQRVLVRRHHQQRHQVLEHRAAP